MTVRLSCTSNRLGGVPTNGIAAFKGQASSMTSPVLISLIALSTVCGFMWFAAPRSSPAPHFEGQRALSAGGDHDDVWAAAGAAQTSKLEMAKANRTRLIGSSRYHRFCVRVHRFEHVFKEPEYDGVAGTPSTSAAISSGDRCALWSSSTFGTSCSDSQRGQNRRLIRGMGFHIPSAASIAAI